jgi:group I intron endonuclease
MERILYKITNLINGKCYIGQTKNFDRRMKAHIRVENTYSIIHKAIKKYGEENFIFEKLAICEDSIIDEIEAKAIKVFNCLIPNGYNIDIGGGACKQLNATTKEKISASWHNSKTRTANMSKSMKEYRKRMRDAGQDMIFTDEIRAKISKGLKGKIRSKAHGDAISKSKKGIPSKLKGILRTDEDKKKVSEGLKKYFSNFPKPQQKITKPRSEETKKKIAESHKGIFPSEESKRKMSESQKKLNRERREILCLQRKSL